MKDALIYGFAFVICCIGLHRLISESERLQIASTLGREVDVSKERLTKNRKPLFGYPSAPIKLVVFFDYECPPCRIEWKHLREVTKDNRYCLYVRHFPLTKIHAFAEQASMTMLSSGENNLALHDELMSARLCKDYFKQNHSGLSMSPNAKAKSLLAEDLLLAKAIGIQHTPTTYAIFQGRVYDVRDWSTL